MAQPSHHDRIAAAKLRTRDVRDLLWVLPSVLCTLPLFIYWCQTYRALHLPSLFAGIFGGVFWAGLLFAPLVTLYNLGILVFYIARRNPVGLFLALTSLPFLGYASFVVLVMLFRGVPLQP